jgi:hypothetical protein
VRTRIWVHFRQMISVIQETIFACEEYFVPLVLF